MRPESITWFERLYLGSLAVGVVNLLLARDEVPAIYATAVLLIFAAMFALTLLLVLLVSRKGSRVAKWVLVGLFAISLLGLVPGFLGDEAAGFAWNDWVAWIMTAAATGLLFTPSAREWMRRRRSPAAGRDGLERTFE